MERLQAAEEGEALSDVTEEEIEEAARELAKSEEESGA